MKKKIMPVLAVMALAVGVIAFPVMAQEVEVSVVAPAEPAAGSDFVAQVAITDVTDLFTAEYKVSFDDTVLELTGVTDGVIGGDPFPVIYAPPTPGVDTVVQNVPTIFDAVSGSGYLAELHFHVIGSPGDTSDIDLIDGMLGDAEAVEIPATWTGDSITVAINHAPDAPISPSPAPGATDVSLSPTLSVYVYDEDGDAMTVTFYLDGTEIGTDTVVGSGTASVTRAGLAPDTPYTWYAKACDGEPLCATSATWSFRTTEKFLTFDHWIVWKFFKK